VPEPDITELVRRNREAILPAAAHCGATNVRLIGSVARGEARAESDIDFFVTWRRAKGEGVSLIRPVGQFGQGGSQPCHLGEFPGLARTVRTRLHKPVSPSVGDGAREDFRVSGRV
jgi:predicted nucleotidyltransferase